MQKLHFENYLSPYSLWLNISDSLSSYLLDSLTTLACNAGLFLASSNDSIISSLKK